MKVAILGGSFDPVHNGHIALAKATLTELSYDKVLFIPASISPFKREGAGASAADRLNMVKLAIEDCPYFDCDSYEIEKGGMSFTLDTIKYLYGKFKKKRIAITGKIGLIIGDDLIKDFPKWKGVGELQNSTNIILGRRYNGYSKFCDEFLQTDNSASPNVLQAAFVLKNKIIQLSSTEIRQKFAEKKDCRSLVPKKVFEYITQNSLYGCKND